MAKQTETTVPLSIDIVNQAIEYIENHLLDKVSPEDISCALYISVSTLNILFKTLIGLTVMEYIRNRRLSLAGQELISTDISIINLAYKYGYETPEAFTKAFTRCFSIPPSVLRRTQKHPSEFLPITLSLSLHGGWNASSNLTESFSDGQEIGRIIDYDESIKKQGGTAMMESELSTFKNRQVKYHVCTSKMKEKDNWNILLALSGALDKKNIAFKVDGKTMIFAHGLEFQLEKICLTFCWNEEDKVKNFFDYEGKNGDTPYEDFKFFDTKFKGMKIRCMFYNDITEVGNYEALFKNAEPVAVDDNIIMVQTLEFYLANAESETEYYKMVEKFLKQNTK